MPRRIAKGMSSDRPLSAFRSGTFDRPTPPASLPAQSGGVSTRQPSADNRTSSTIAGRKVR